MILCTYLKMQICGLTYQTDRRFSCNFTFISNVVTTHQTRLKLPVAHVSSGLRGWFSRTECLCTTVLQSEHTGFGVVVAKK